METNNALELKKTILEKIHFVLTIVILLWLNTGISTYVLYYVPSFCKIFICAIWIVISIVLNKDFLKQLIKIAFPLVVFAIIMLISFQFTDNSNIRMYFTNLKYIMVIVSILIYCINYEKKYRNIILGILVIDTIYVGINTFIKLIENPLVSRTLSAGTEIKIETLKDLTKYYGVGSYSYFYSLVMLLLIVVDSLFENRNVKKWIGIICFSILLIKGQFTIAVLLYIIFALKVILERLVKNKKNVYLILAAILLVIALLMPVIGAMRILPHEMQVRFEEMTDVISGENISDTDLQSRLNLYTKSINSFLSNIFIGSFGVNSVRRSFYFSRFFSAYMEYGHFCYSGFILMFINILKIK